MQAPPTITCPHYSTHALHMHTHTETKRLKYASVSAQKWVGLPRWLAERITKYTYIVRPTQPLNDIPSSVRIHVLAP